MITIDEHEGTAVASITGDIDMANIHVIEDAISYHVKSDALGFVLDLSAVTYLDSAGVRLMYKLEERANSRQQLVVLVVPTGAQITRSLEAAGVIGSLKIVPNVTEAVDAIRTN